MNATSVVSVIFDSDCDSDWNGSDEEQDSWLEEDSFRMDRLSMELGKMADTRDSVFYSMFCIRRRGRRQGW